MTKTPENTDETRIVLIPEDLGGGRLDATLAKLVPDYSRTRLQAFIAESRVMENGIVITDSKYKAQAGTELTITLPPIKNPFPQPEDIPLSIIYEDDDVLVVEKTVGLVVHPAAGHGTGTLVNALLHHCGEALAVIGEPMRPGIVHRLDKDTSGLLVIAKTNQAYRNLCAQFADHGQSGCLERMYYAFIWGVPERSSGTIDAPLARSTINREKNVVSNSESAKYAVTHYQLLETYTDKDQLPIISLIRCQLETGRTHQIRVHMAHVGHPVVGDTMYGSGFKTKINRLNPKQKEVVQQLSRQALHAGVLGFEHPQTKDVLSFESPLPEDLVLLKTVLQAGT